MEQKELSPQQLERADTYKRRDLIVGLALEYFQGTALVEDKPWTPEDPEQVKRFLIAAAPYAHPKVFPSYWDHLVITSIYARKVAEQAPRIGLDPNEAESLELQHDLGRIAIPHRYLRNDIVEDSIFHRAHIRPELLEKLPSIPKIIGVKVPFISKGAYRSIDNVPPTQRALDVTDNFGKMGKNGQLFSMRDHEEYAAGMSARYTGGMWPSERAGRKAYSGNIEKQRFAMDLLSAELKWLEEEYGIHFSELREEVIQELSNPEHQEFLLALKDAQETLDPNVDKALGRPPIKAIVFDVGDVLFQGKAGEELDDELRRRISAFFNCPEGQVGSIFKTLNKGGLTGQISEQHYLRRFWTLAGKKAPENIAELREPFTYPDLYQPDPKMQEIIYALAQNPEVKLYLFSNAIAVLARAFLPRLFEYYPEIQPQNILISSAMGVAKGVNNESAYRRLIETVSLDPESVLLIDDKEDYTTVARASYNMRGFTFRGNPFQNLTAINRLKAELQKAGLI